MGQSWNLRSCSTSPRYESADKYLHLYWRPYLQEIARHRRQQAPPHQKIPLTRDISAVAVQPNSTQTSSLGAGNQTTANLTQPIPTALAATPTKVGLGYIGLAVGPVEHFKPGVLITEVIPGSPAANAGLTAGDAILKVDGKPVHDPQTFSSAIANRTPGSTIRFVYRVRDTLEAVAVISVGEKPDQQ